MKGYHLNIEETTLRNEDYRRVLYTGKHSQLVLMCIKPGDAIGEEVHKNDQFLRFEAGTAEVTMDGVVHTIDADDALIIPAGMRHNVTNTGDVDLKLYTIYAPPEHKDGTIEHTKADEIEEHFDGVTTE